MDAVALREHVIAVLSEEAQHIPVGKSIEVVLITDTTHDHYQVISMGWDGPRREYHTLVHIRMLEGKAWIERDGTA